MAPRSLENLSAENLETAPDSVIGPENNYLPLTGQYKSGNESVPYLYTLPEKKSISNRSRKISIIKNLPGRCTNEILHGISEGDCINTAEGIKGTVSVIYIKRYTNETHYYFTLKKGKTLLYII